MGKNCRRQGTFFLLILSHLTVKWSNDFLDDLLRLITIPVHKRISKSFLHIVVFAYSSVLNEMTTK